MEEASQDFKDFDPKELAELGVNFLVKLSIVPKIPEDKVAYRYVDTVMKEDVKIRALPPVDLYLALPASYPSNQRPLFLQTTKMYESLGLDSFLKENLNARW